MFNMMPGCYSFRDELDIIALWFKEQAELILYKIYEFDRLIH